MSENRLNFNQCTLPYLDKTFGLRWTLELPALTDAEYKRQRAPNGDPADGHTALQSAELADILGILKTLKTLIIALTAPTAEADAVG